VITWPTADGFFAKRLQRRSDVLAAGLARPIALDSPKAGNDCSEPFIVGACDESVAWSGTLRLVRRR
jgi:hypothetical protein